MHIRYYYYTIYIEISLINIIYLHIVIFNTFVRIVRILSIKSSLTQISLHTTKIFFFTDIQHLASMLQRVKIQKENYVIVLHLRTKLLNRWRERYNYVK